MIAFLDVEASSLSAHSHPVEVGWCREDGTSASFLIRPEPSWMDWDADSAEVHGITRARLAADGIPAAAAARRMHVAIGGCDVHSDAPGADAIWLPVLMRTAGLPPFRLRHHYETFGPIFKPLVERLPPSSAASLAQVIVARAEAQTERLPGVRHRAEHDARRLYETWRRVGKMVDSELRGA